MAILAMFDKLAPFVQLALVLGSFATIFLVACNRTAATNLITFLRSLNGILLEKDNRSQQFFCDKCDQQKARIGSGGMNRVMVSATEESTHLLHDITLNAGERMGQDSKSEPGWDNGLN